MDRPKRPLTIWIALTLLIIFGGFIATAAGYATIQMFHRELETGPMNRLIIRLSILAVALLGMFVSVIFVWLRKNLGRWLAIGSLALFAFQVLGLSVIFEDAAQRAVGLTVVAIIGLAPLVLVTPFLLIGRRTTEYFNAGQASPPLPDPPSPPVFGD